MTITQEISLPRFAFWSTAANNVKELSYGQLKQLEDILEDMYPDGIDANDLNNLMKFDFDTVKEWLGIVDVNEGCKSKKKLHLVKEALRTAKQLRKEHRQTQSNRINKLTIKEDNSNKPYMYFTKHGIGPGMLPNDVKVIDWYDVNDYITVIYTNRFLTTQELSYYDIYPETVNDKLLDKYNLEVDEVTGKVYRK